MKSNLALLDKAVQGAVALELGDGDHNEAALAELGVEPKRYRSVAGLRVVSNAARDAEVDPVSAERTDKLLRYRADSDLVRKKLGRVNMEPVAVLPLTAWAHICDTAGFYRFKPEGDKVRVGDTKAIIDSAWQKAREEARAKIKKSEPRQLFLIAVGAVSAVGSIPVVYYYGSWWSFWLMIIIGVAMIWANWPDQMPSDQDLQPAVIKNIEGFADERVRDGTLVKYLWPNLRESKDGSQLRISFPEPPLEVQHRLIAVERARLPIHIAVVGEAVSFTEDPTKVLLKDQKRQWEETQQAKDWQTDPIAYVVEGSAIAIIAQFGDFQIEKDVVEMVINSDDLI